MGHITQDHLKQSAITLPSNIDIANKLEEKLCPILDAIVKNNQEISILTKQRGELLPLLMNGQVNCDLYFIDTIRFCWIPLWLGIFLGWLRNFVVSGVFPSGGFGRIELLFVDF